MKSKYALALVLGLFAGTASFTASALEQLVESVAEGCRLEIDSHCSDVTPGEGRILACLYAYEDKLSGKCEYALYDAADQLERFLSDMTYVVNECWDDLATHCGDVEEGEGRIASCLLDNKDSLASRCANAIDEVGLHVVE